MKLSRATELIAKMPHKLTADDITKREATELWSFMTTSNKLNITQHMLKVNLAKECGVFMERLEEVTEGLALARILMLESPETIEHELTLKQVVEVIRNARNDDEWILDLCHSINEEEAELIWRWALDYYWKAIRNRMRAWFSKASGVDSTHGVDTQMAVIFDGLSVDKVSSSFTKLSKWTGDVPDSWWFIPDCGTLLYIGDRVVKERSGKINGELTPLVEGEVNCWCWSNPTGTGRRHSKDTVLPFSTYQEPMFHEWHESQVILDSYARGGFLIYHEGNYTLLSNGSSVLYAQLSMIRKNADDKFELSLAFMDGDEAVAEDMIVLDNLTFELESALKRRGVSPRVKFVNHEVEDCLVVKVNYTWSPTHDWHLKFDSVEDDMGIDDIDDINDYYTVVA